MLALEVEIANQAAQHNHGKPYLVPVRVNLEGKLPDPLGPILDPIQYAMWKGPSDNQRLWSELLPVLENPPARRVRPDTGDGHGAVPLDSEYYIVRRTDDEFLEAIANRDSIVLIKGPAADGQDVAAGARTQPGARFGIESRAHRFSEAQPGRPQVGRRRSFEAWPN